MVCELLKSLAARLTQMGGDENALWLTVNGGPEWTPQDDLEFRINARMRLDLPVVQGDYVNIKDGRNQMAQQGPSAWPGWTNTDNMHRNALSEETEPSITKWVAISFTMPVAKRAQIATRKKELQSLASPCSSTDDSGHGWTYSFASLRCANEQSTRQPAETEGDHCKSGKTSEHSAGEVHRRDSPLGHRAQALERNVVRTGPLHS